MQVQDAIFRDRKAHHLTSAGKNGGGTR